MSQTETKQTLRYKIELVGFKKISFIIIVFDSFTHLQSFIDYSYNENKYYQLYTSKTKRSDITTVSETKVLERLVLGFNRLFDSTW